MQLLSSLVLYSAHLVTFHTLLCDCYLYFKLGLYPLDIYITFCFHLYFYLALCPYVIIFTDNFYFST